MHEFLNDIVDIPVTFQIQSPRVDLKLEERLAKAQKRNRFGGHSEAAIRFNSDLYIECTRTLADLAGFGLSPKDYVKLYKEQDGKCAICNCVEDRKQLAIDHDHETNKVRGLLCSRCNTAIGSFKDSPELLRKAIAYLELER